MVSGTMFCANFVEVFMKPFLKWPGNKYRIIKNLSRVFPKGKRLVEPFGGSGAVLLNLEYPKYVLAEKNADLINLYQTLRDSKEDFIDFTKDFFSEKYNNERVYYKHRKLFNNTNDSVLKAALFVYLNRHGYNGLCRYNLDGSYNVPYGFYKKPYFPQKEMQNFAIRIAKASLKCWDYRKTMQYARKGDVVYCDPPYIPLSATSNFTQYGPFGFDNFDQIELAKKARQLSEKGITVIISNHNIPFARKLYAGAKIHSIDVQRNISCIGSNRRKVKEVIAVFD